MQLVLNFFFIAGGRGGVGGFSGDHMVIRVTHPENQDNSWPTE